MDFYHMMIKLPDKSEWSKLNKGERVILKILLQELSTKEIAAELKIYKRNTFAVLLKLRTKFKCSKTCGYR